MKMRELIDSLDTSSRVDYFLDTCFLLHMIQKGHTKQLINFCKDNKVGMSSFNLDEIDHVHHRLTGTVNHHLRDILKKKIFSKVIVDVHPGDREAERQYVQDLDKDILRIVPDPSDAVLFVQALKMRASLLTKDKHHLFTTGAENYLQEYGIKVYKELP